MTAVKPGWQTSEFWITLITQLLNAAVQSGIVGDGTQLVKALAFAAAALTTIGYVLSRAHVKASATPETPEPVGPDPQRGFMRLDTMLMVFMIGVCVALAASACGAFKSEAKHAGHDFVDCMKPDLAGASSELASVLEKSVPAVLSDTGKVDRAGFKSLTSGLKSDAAGCAIATVIAELSKPRGTDTKASPLAIDAKDLQDTWSEVDRDQFGGRTFQVGDGS